MSQNDLDFLPLRVIHVGDGGRRSFDPVDKRRLVEACLQPGASLSGLALKAGVNANQLRKWVRLHQSPGARVQEEVASGPSTFVPVIAIDAPAPLLRPASERRLTEAPWRSQADVCVAASAARRESAGRPPRRQHTGSPMKVFHPPDRRRDIYDFHDSIRVQARPL